MTTQLTQICFNAILLTSLVALVACSSRPVVRDTDRLHPPAQSSKTQPTPKAGQLPTYPGDDIEQADEMEAWAGVFPRPSAIEPQVKFWRNVYGTWSRSQVAFHDNRYMNIIYEVFQLPGATLEGYSLSQKEFIQERFDYWKYRLRALEDKVASGAPLNPSDQRLMDQIAQGTNDRLAVQGASERLRYQRGLRERFKRGLEISGSYDRHFRQIFRRQGLPEDLAYLPHVESSFQSHARSSAGAVGMWQFTSGAAKMFMNGNDSEAARRDPIASAYGAARYLRHAYDKLGSWPLAVTSYNHGIGGMQRAKNVFGHNFPRIVKHYDHPLFGFASRNYYAEFLAARDIANNPEHFFPEGVSYEKGTDWMLATTIADPALTAPSEPRVTDPPMKAAMIGQSRVARLEPKKIARFESSRIARTEPKKIARFEPSRITRTEPKKIARVERPRATRSESVKAGRFTPVKVVEMDRKQAGPGARASQNQSVRTAKSATQASRQKTATRATEPKVTVKEARRSVPVNARAGLRTAQNSRSAQTSLR